MNHPVFELLERSRIRVASVRIQPYRLPMTREWVTRHGRLSVRSGFLLWLDAGRHGAGVGECAPLPSAGTESFAEAKRALADFRSMATNRRLAGSFGALDRLNATPAARCAAETAILDLLAREQSVSLARLLATTPRATIRVNAAVGALDDGLANRARMAVAEGFDTLKLKLGTGDPASDVHVLNALLDDLPPSVVLRLDANGAWTMPQARQLIAALPAERIDSIEEPLARPSIEAVAELQSRTAIPIALDESLVRLGSDDVLSAAPARRVVIKLAVAGGPLAAFELALRARRAGLQVVVTSALEMPVGLLAGIHLAAALPGNLAHGLGTGHLFALASGRLVRPRRGAIGLPTDPGLGIAAATLRTGGPTEP